MRKITRKNKPSSYFTSYLGRIFDVNQYPQLINKLSIKIKKFQQKQSFDAIAFTGTSGCSVAFTLSYKLGIPLICIRKNSDNSHFNGLYEGVENVKRYIIVDDFIASGDTIATIKKNVLLRSKRAKLVGIFLYGQSANQTTHKKIPVYIVK